MSFMKNKFSYALWACYAVLTGFAYVGFMILTMKSMAINDLSIILCFTLLPIVFLAGIFLLARWFVKEYHEKISELWKNKGFVAGWILLAILIGLGIFMRCNQIGMAGEDFAYFETAMIKGQPFAIPAHATQALYLYMLHGIFYLFGNEFLAGIGLQIALQVIGVLLWHFALKKLMGNVASFLFVAVIMLHPYFIKESLTLSTNVLFFTLFGLAMLLIGIYYKHLRHVGSLKWTDTLWTILMGAMVSIISFFDTIGLVLFAVLFFVKYLRNKKDATDFNEEVIKNISMLFGLQILGYFVGYLLLMYLDAVLSNSTVQIVMGVGVEMFQPKGQIDLISQIAGFSIEQTLMWLIISFVLLLGIPAFWMRRDRENQLIWFSLFAAVMLLYVFEFNANAMHYDFMVVVSVILLAISGLQGILIVPDEANIDRFVKTPNVNQEKHKIKKHKKEKQAKEKQTKKQTEKVVEKVPENNTKEGNSSSVDYYKPREGVTYIENPLPLPKRSGKKGLGYRYEVAESDMHYDIVVKEQDDFDI